MYAIKQPKFTSPIAHLQAIEKVHEQCKRGEEKIKKKMLSIEILGRGKDDYDELAQRCWHALKPSAWIEEMRLSTILDLSMTDILEDVETGEIHELTPLQQWENEKHIKAERTKVFKKRKKQGFANGMKEKEFFDFWLPIAYINGERAVPIVLKERKFKGKIQTWILDKISETSQISPTKLVSLYFNEMELKTVKEAKKALAKTIDNMLSNKWIELVDKGTYSYFKVKKVEIINGYWYKVLN